MANPQLVGDILLEGLRVRRESEDRMVEISKELELLYKRKEEMENFAKHDDICTKLKQALQVFKNSPSLRKKQLIQTLVPKLVVDEKKDELNFYINPLLDKSFKNKGLAISEIEPILTLRPNFIDRQKSESITQDLEMSQENDCHSEEKSSGSGLMAGWTGLEPAASGVTGRRYNQLNYHPVWVADTLILSGF
jgi:hypothetical protein